MIWLVPLSLVALFALFSVMRAIRYIGDRRHPVHAANGPIGRTPSDDFREQVWLPLCQRAAELLQIAIGRPLTTAERERVWKARSPLALEILIKELGTAASAGAALALLATLPSGLSRPDPTGWCRNFSGVAASAGGDPSPNGPQ